MALLVYWLSASYLPFAHRFRFHPLKSGFDAVLPTFQTAVQAPIQSTTQCPVVLSRNSIKHNNY
ncbi:hypothetical protein BN8_00242 [Fibrisoma limi BUZ 3]|uniref:Uncharacterized protein n=1 Tax=Fibrisoma limi BUZ 3 TaxID=1185876 RepID=I2GBQ0_9BACT|nr:hypothetical protein BN8_00242 [Fibrisoma limi BUZ 3]